MVMVTWGNPEGDYGQLTAIFVLFLVFDNNHDILYQGVHRQRAACFLNKLELSESHIAICSRVAAPEKALLVLFKWKVQ
jgi:hypothetical protein